MLDAHVAHGAAIEHSGTSAKPAVAVAPSRLHELLASRSLAVEEQLDRIDIHYDFDRVPLALSRGLGRIEVGVAVFVQPQPHAMQPARMPLNAQP